MAKLRANKWVHGNITYGNCEPIKVQVTTDGWFSSIDIEKCKSIMVSGPWKTQESAERAIIKTLEELDLIRFPPE